MCLGGDEYDLPSDAEQRLMVYSVLANGGKGIMYFAGPSFPNWRLRYYISPTYAIDFWGATSEIWDLVSGLGRNVTAIGQALLETDFELNRDFQIVDAPKVEFRHRRTNALYYEGPALTVGVLKQRGGAGHVLVVQNQDTDKQRSGVLAIAPDAFKGKVLCDLVALANVEASGGRLAVDLAPGDARFLYCGPEAEARKMLDAVHANHYRNERVVYQIEAEPATLNKAPTPAAFALAKQAADAFAAGRMSEAHQKILDARKTLAEEMKKDAGFYSAWGALCRSRELLSQCATAFTAQIDLCAPPALRRSVRGGQPYKDNPDAQLQKYLDEAHACFIKRMELEDKVYAGGARDVAAEAQALLKESERLAKEAIPYVRSKAK